MDSTLPRIVPLSLHCVTQHYDYQFLQMHTSLHTVEETVMSQGQREKKESQKQSLKDWTCSQMGGWGVT